MITNFRKLFATHGLFSIRTTNRSSFDTNICPIIVGRYAVLVQLLVGSGRDTWPRYIVGDVHAYIGDHVHGTAGRHTAGRLCQGNCNEFVGNVKNWKIYSFISMYIGTGFVDGRLYAVRVRRPWRICRCQSVRRSISISNKPCSEGLANGKYWPRLPANL